MKTKFYKGQTVYCQIYGDGIVIDIIVTSKFPIRVNFDIGYRTYTNNGCITDTAMPTLIPSVEKFPREVMVRGDCKNRWYKRNCIMLYGGKAVCEIKGENNFFQWDEYKEIQDEKLENIIKELKDLDSKQIKEILSRIS